MRVFEIAAVGRLSILPSRLAREDLPELTSPQMARRSGRSRRRPMRCKARMPGNSFDPGEIALSSRFRACLSSATILPVSGWSDSTDTGPEAPPAPPVRRSHAPRHARRSPTMRRAPVEPEPAFTRLLLCDLGLALGSGRRRGGSRGRDADRRIRRAALRLPEARKVPLDDPIVLAGVA